SRVTTQSSQDGRLFGNEIQLNQGHAARRLERPVQPLRQSWKKHLVLGRRLVATGDGPKRQQGAAAETVRSDGVDQLVDAQFGDLVAQARERLEFGIARGLLADGCYLKLIPSGRRPRPIPSLRLDQVPQPLFDKVHAVIKMKFIVALDVMQPD